MKWVEIDYTLANALRRKATQAGRKEGYRDRWELPSDDVNLVVVVDAFSSTYYARSSSAYAKEISPPHHFRALYFARVDLP